MTQTLLGHSITILLARTLSMVFIVYISYLDRCVDDMNNWETSTVLWEHVTNNNWASK